MKPPASRAPSRSRPIPDVHASLLFLVTIAVLLWPQPAAAQEAASGGQATTAAASTAHADDENTWAFSSALYFYQVVGDRNYAQPTVTADRDWLHLEARYNYEDIETGSMWLGYTMSGGEALSWELTPMLGGVFGRTDGVAPGYRATAGWRSIEFYSEGEYVFAASDAADRFFYNWSELTVAPLAWLRLGLVTQRTRVYETEHEIQRGLLVEISYKALSTAFHLFDPSDTHPVVVLSATVAF